VVVRVTATLRSGGDTTPLTVIYKVMPMTVTPLSLVASLKPRLTEPFWCRLTKTVLEIEAVKRVSVLYYTLKEYSFIHSFLQLLENCALLFTGTV